MPMFTVRVVGSSPVWADIEIEADSLKEAKQKIQDEGNPAEAADWQRCEGGNGVDDWEFSGEAWKDGKEVFEGVFEEEEEHSDV
jgi:hypothetical protein